MKDKKAELRAVDTLFEILAKTNDIDYTLKTILILAEIAMIIIFAVCKYFMGDSNDYFWMLVMIALISFCTELLLRKYRYIMFEKKSSVFRKLRYIPVSKKSIYLSQFKKFMEAYAKHFMLVALLGTLLKLAIERGHFDIVTELIGLVLLLIYSVLFSIAVILFGSK